MIDMKNNVLGLEEEPVTLKVNPSIFFKITHCRLSDLDTGSYCDKINAAPVT